MKFTRPLDNLLGQQSKVKIIRFLVNSSAELAGREIARSVGLTQRITHASLMDLWKHGVVNMRRVGKAKLYKINKGRVLVSDGLIPLFVFENNLLKRLSALIIRKIKKFILSIIIFGSIAEGNEQPGSDIDLLIILKEKTNPQKVESALDGLSLVVSEKFGNFLSPVLLKENQFRRRYKQGDKFIKTIVARGKIIYGKTFMEVIYA